MCYNELYGGCDCTSRHNDKITHKPGWGKSSLLYSYQFDVVSLIAIMFLLTIYVLRRNYKTRSNFILLLLMVCDLLGSLFDLVSCFTISYPDRYPMWFNLIIVHGYQLFFNYMGVLFFLYIDSKAKIGAMWKTSKLIAVICLVFQTVVIVTSPLTHLVSYFDGTEYKHGPMMMALYVIAFALLIMSVVMFWMERARFNKYQVFAICLFVLGILTGVVIQANFPSLLVGQFSCTLVLYFIYTALENPVYYTYKDTNCYNRKTFIDKIKTLSRRENMRGSSISIVGISIRDYSYIKHNLSLKNLERLSSNIAQYIHDSFDENGFCISDDKFVVILDHWMTYDFVTEHFDDFFAMPIGLVNNNISVAADYIYIHNIDLSLGYDAIENGINYILEGTENGNRTIEDFGNVVEKINRRHAISHSLQKALLDENFEVYYQPIYNIHTGRFSNVEALVRLNDPELGFICPDEFISIAEQEGRICDIGEIVFRKVCQFINESRCIDKGVDYVEVNLSPIQCMQEDIVDRFMDIMRENNVKPSWINLEITEGVELDENGTMVQNIIRFNELGISFSLDDYGSGFASADYLYKLPVYIVKIDKSILWQALKNNNAMIVLENTVDMVKALGKRIVVEGVEDRKMVKIIEQMGCDFMQGFYYSKPVPQQQYIDFIERNNLENG